MTTRRFRPRAWSVLAYLPVVAILLGLGSWQTHRGLQKQGLDAALDRDQAPLVWHTGQAPRLDPPLRVRVAGQYLQAPVLLQDSQSYQRQPGYHLWQVFRAEDGTPLLVNRGWLAATAAHAVPPLPPAPVGPQSLQGLWRPLPVPGLRLTPPPCVGTVVAEQPLQVQYPDVERLRCLTGLSLPDGILLLDPSADTSLVRDWSVGQAVPPTRHFGYAAQWFMFALVLSYFFVRLNLRKPPDV